jgi:flagellin-specific chaperone FliS
MENLEVTKIIENLKGRRPYEEKRAIKLGFTSLYKYIESKVLQKQSVAKNIEKLKDQATSKESQSKSKSCNCC